jgi:hypothetical protein
MIFGVGLAALRAAETLEAVAMLPELPAFDAAFFAIHEYSLHEAVAVCKGNSRPGFFSWNRQGCAGKHGVI